MFFLESPVVANYDFDVDPGSIEGTPDQGRALHATCNRFFANNRNGRVTERRSRGVVKCFRFAAVVYEQR